MRNWDVTFVKRAFLQTLGLCDFLACKGTSLLWWMGPRLVPEWERQRCPVEGWAHVASLSILTEKGYDTFSQEMMDTSLQRKRRQSVCLVGRPFKVCVSELQGLCPDWSCMHLRSIRPSLDLTDLSHASLHSPEGGSQIHAACFSASQTHV